MFPLLGFAEKSCILLTLAKEVDYSQDWDECTINGPDALNKGETAEYIYSVGNKARVKISSNACGSLSLKSELGATNLVCDKIVRISDAGKWVKFPESGGETAPSYLLFSHGDCPFGKEPDNIVKIGRSVYDLYAVSKIIKLLKE